MTFQVIPAIDIRGGKCVRLLHGDYARETVYGDDPVAMAERWAALGAPLIHVVDLDGAREQRPVNHDVIARMCRAVSVPIEVSGGVRSIETVRALFDAGAGRVQIGSAAVRDPALVRDAVAAFGERICISIDCKDGEVMANGWLDGTGVALLDLAQAMAGAGVARIMVTDIARDGALTGPNVELYRELVAALPVPVVASGGVATYDDLSALANAGCEGVVVGKALYEGAIDLAMALQRTEAAAC